MEEGFVVPDGLEAANSAEGSELHEVVGVDSDKLAD